MSTTESVDGGPTDKVAGGGRQPRSLIRQRDFQFLLFSKLISTTGDMFYLVALPFLVFGAGGGVGSLTAILTVFGVARVCSAFPAGVLTDRIGPRKVMIAADLARAAAVCGVALSLQQGQSTTPLLVAVAVLGIGEGCFQPASQAMVPTLVSDEQLPSANGLAIGSNLVAAAVGPALGGLGVLAGSPTLMLLLDATSFLASMVLLMLIRGGSPATTVTSPDEAMGTTTLWQFIRRTPLFRVVLMMMAVFGLSVAGTLEIALPVLAAQRPDLGAAGYGLLMSGLGLGWLLGAALSRRASRFGPQGWMVVALLAADGVLLAALPWAPGTAGMLVVMISLGGFDGLLLVTVLTVIQRMPPPYLRGRVMGVLAFTDFAAYPLSALFAGVVLSRFPVADYFVLTGIGVCVVAVIGALSPSVRTVRAIRPNPVPAVESAPNSKPGVAQ